MKRALIILLSVILAMTEITALATSDETIQKEEYGRIVIVLRDEASGDVIPDQTFELYDVNDRRAATFTTNNGGSITASIPTGKFYIIQTSVADGYKLNKEHHEFEIEHDGGCAVIEVRNARNASKGPNPTDINVSYTISEGENAGIEAQAIVPEKQPTASIVSKPGDEIDVLPSDSQAESIGVSLTLDAQKEIVKAQNAQDNAANSIYDVTAIILVTDRNTGKIVQNGHIRLMDDNGNPIGTGLLTTDEWGRCKISLMAQKAE